MSVHSSTTVDVGDLRDVQVVSVGHASDPTHVFMLAHYPTTVVLRGRTAELYAWFEELRAKLDEHIGRLVDGRALVAVSEDGAVEQLAEIPHDLPPRERSGSCSAMWGQFDGTVSYRHACALDAGHDGPCKCACDAELVVAEARP